MSRYYKLIVTNPSDGTVITPPGFSSDLLGGATYTSFVNGTTLTDAWDIELDLPIIGQGTPFGDGAVCVWGISLQEISQANDLAGKNISIYGGMQAGLPLANPAQSGLMYQGFIFQAFGNWIETDMTLDLVVKPGTASANQTGGTGSNSKPRNIVLNWKSGATLASALQTTLNTAFPDYTANINISDQIVRSGDDAGYYSSLNELSQYVGRVSKNIVKTQGYQGVTVLFTPNNTISVSDGTGQSSSSGQQGGQIDINFTDLIGQPTWIEPAKISVKTVMRADINVDGQITLPPTQVTNTAQALSSLTNNSSAFQGTFTVTSIRNVGRYRNPSADAWVSVIEAVSNQGTSSSSGSMASSGAG